MTNETKESLKSFCHFIFFQEGKDSYIFVMIPWVALIMWCIFVFKRWMV